MKYMVENVLLENLIAVINDQIKYTADILKQEIPLPPTATTACFLSKLYLSSLEEGYDYDDIVDSYINSVLASIEEKQSLFNILKGVINLYPPYMKSITETILLVEADNGNPDGLKMLKEELYKHIT